MDHRTFGNTSIGVEVVMLITSFVSVYIMSIEEPEIISGHRVVIDLLGF